MLQKLTANLSGVVRKQTLEGHEYIIAPCVMGAEGVLVGNNGAGYYPADEWAKAVPAWNMKPVVVYHPTKDGQMVSAADPDILEKSKVGFLLNTKYNDKLRTEVWLDVEKTNLVDNRITAAIESGTITEVSTGLFVNQHKESGKFGDKSYDWIAKDHQPDHLAILPDQKGAYSVADGAGLLQVNSAGDEASIVLKKSVEKLISKISGTIVGNQLSFGDIASMLSKQLASTYGEKGRYWNGWIEEIYPDRVVFCDGDRSYYQVSYSLKDGKVTIDTDLVEVVRTTDFIPVANQRNEEMDKSKHVDSLIGNGFSEDDRKWLMDLPPSQLAKIKPVPAQTPVTNSQPTPAPTPTPTPEPAKVVTVNEWLNSAPPEVRKQIERGLAAEKQQKASLIATITSNTNNPFSKEFLETKDIEELQGLAKLATPQQPTTNSMFNSGFSPNYAGAAGYSTPIGNQIAEEPFVMPPIFDQK